MVWGKNFAGKDYSKKTVDDLWFEFRKTLRQEIKKSEQFNVWIEECESENELKQFYNLYVATVKRHKNIPLPFSRVCPPCLPG